MFGAKPRPQPKCVLEIVNLEFEDLIEAKKMIDAEVAKRSAAELESAKSRVAAMASSLGVSIASLFGLSTETKQKRKKRKESPVTLYVNPDNPEQIYRGKGKRPHWLQGKLDAGHDLSEFLCDTNRAHQEGAQAGAHGSAS